MAFDFDAYLAGKDAANQKLQSVVDASKAKVAELEAYNTTKPQTEGPAWVQQLGLEPGSFIGNRVNDLASLVSGTSRMAGQVTALPVSFDGGFQSTGIPQTHIDAYNRKVGGIATPEDLQLLEQRVGSSGMKAVDALQHSQDQRATARSIVNATDLTGIVDQANRQGLSADLAKGFGENWDKVTSGETGKAVSGLAGLMMNAGSAILNNPSAVREYIIENAPQLFVGAAGKVGQGVMAASNIGYAVDEYQKGMENFAKENGGALPSLEQQRTMALQSASLALAEHAGDLISLHGAGVIGKTSVKRSLSNVGKAVGEGFLGEAPTEGFQTYMEGQIEGKPATPGQIYESAVIGGASGAGLSGGGRTVAELAKATPEHAAERVDAVQKAAARDAAIQSGDVSSWINPKSADYSPAQAIAALHGNSQLDTSDEAKKAANLKQADEILSTLQKERNVTAANQLDTDTRQAHIESLKKAMAAVDPTDTETVQMFKDEIKDQEAELAKPVDKAEAQKRRARLTQLDSELAQAKQNRDAFGLSQETPESLDAAVSVLKDTTKTAEHQGAADKIITLAMAAPDRLDPQVVRDLANDESNGLSVAQRNYLRSFDESRLAANALMSMDDVSKAIYLGRTKSNGQHDYGIAEYRSGIATAIAGKDKRSALMQLVTLESFATDHSSKAAAYQKALDVKPGTQIHKVKGGGWIVATGDQAFTGTRDQIKSQLSKNGGLVATSPKFAADMATEADAVSKAAAEMRQAIDLAFSPKTVAKAGAKPQAEAAPVNIPTQKGATDSQQRQTSAQEVTANTPKEAPANPPGLVTEEEGPLPWETDEEYKQRTQGQQPKQEPASGVVWKDRAKKFTDAELNDRLNALIDLGTKRTFKQQRIFEVLDAEMSSRETAAAGVAPVTDSARETQLKGNSGSSVSSTTVNSQSTSTETSSGSTVKNQSTKDSSTESSKNSEDAKTETVVEANQSTVSDKSTEGTSGLQVLVVGKKFNEQFAGKKLGEVFTQLNKAAAWLTQRKGMPLVDIAAFLSRWNAGEHPALNNFRDVALNWGQGIANNFIKGSLPNPRTGNKVREDQLFRDPVQDFVNEDGSVDENVITAVAYAAYSWFNDSARNKRLSKEDILAMHGLGETDGTVTGQGWRALNGMSAMKDAAINSMGDRVIQALGLKASPDAPANYLATLSTALGMHALRTLEREGLVETGYLPGEDVMEYIDGYSMAPASEYKGKAIYPKLYYVQLKRNPKTLELKTKQGQEIQESQKSSGGVLDKLITGTHPVSEASTQPIPFNQEMAKRTGQEISDEQRAQVEEQQAIPHTVIPAMWNALKVLGREAYLMAAGWKPYNEAKIQAENRDAVQGQNENLEGQFDRMVALVEGHPEGQEFFVNNEVWRNFRVGVSTQNLNMQSSKIHRGTFERPGWRSKISLDDEATVDTYLVGLAQALGIKVDKQRNSETVEKLRARLADPDSPIKDLAIKLNKSTPENSLLSEEEKVQIGELAAANEGMLTLQGLVSLGDYLAALSSGAEEFETTLMVGVDGKTNGPILTHVMLGAGESVDSLFQVLNKGGIYREGDGVSNYNRWKEDSQHQDLYESLTKSLMSRIDQASEEMQAIYAVTKQLIDDMGNVASAGRNLAKTPSTSFFFGSSVEKSIQNMQESFLQAIFDRIEALAAGQAKDINVGQLVAAMNYLIQDPAHTIPADTTVGTLMGMQFTRQQKTLLAEAFGEILGPWIEETMQAEYSTFIERRNSINRQIQASFGIYEAIYSDLRNQEMNRLMDEGEMAFTTVGEPKPNAEGKIDPRQVAERAKYSHLGFRKPLHDMSRAQEEALRKQVKDVLPVVHTAYSHNGGNIDAGLYLAKSSRGMGRSAFHEVKANMGQQFENADGNQAVDMGARAMQRTESSPGVGGVPWMAHSTDAATMGRSTVGTTTLNVFDEAANGAHKTNETARAINQSLTETLLEYSPAEQAYLLLERAVSNAVKLAESGTLSQDARDNILTTLRQALPRNWSKKEKQEILDSQLATTVLIQARLDWFRAEKIRLGALSQMAYVDQYTWEGGEYVVTQEQRNKASEKLTALEKQGAGLPAETYSAAKALGKLLTVKVSATETTVQATTLREATAERQGGARTVGESVADTKTTTDERGATEGSAPRAEAESVAAFEGDTLSSKKVTPFGTLGKSSRNSPEIAAFFKANPKTNAKAVIKFMQGYLAANPEAPNREYYAKLLRKLQTTLPLDMPIEMITAATTEADVLAKHDKPAFAWFVPPQGKNSGQAIYVMGPEFEVSVLKFEVLLHEMVHAATHTKLHSPEGKVHQVELQMLLDAAKEFVKKENLQGYDTKLSNIDELIAYGMTNQKFQQEVLAKVQVTSTVTKTNVSALKAFVTTLSRMLGFNTTAEANGLGVLMANVAGIMALSDAQTDHVQTKVLPMAAMANTYSTLDVHEALDNGTVSPTFQDHLRGVLKSIVDMLHGPFGSFKAELMANQTGTPMDVWLKALDTGKAPFASKILASPFKVSSQEAFVIEQVEATMLSALNASEARTKMAYRELTELYQEVYRSVKVQDFYPGDWATATAGEKQQAADLHDFVFKIEKSSGDRSDYLARFAALGLAHQGFNRVLQRATERSTRQGAEAKSFAERVQGLFEDILGFFRSKVTRTYAGQNADVKLRTLVQQLVDIEAKSRMQLATESAKSSLAQSLEQSIKKVNDIAGDAIQKVVNSAFIKNSANGIVRGAGAMARTAVGGRVDDVLDLLGKLRDEHLNERHGVLASLIGEAKGPNEAMKFALLGTKHNETVRKRVIDSASATALGEFADKGDKLTPEHKAAISQAFLRSGAHALLDTFTMAQIEELVSDPAKLAAAISQFEGQLTGNAKGYWLHQARALGYYKATGKVTSQMLLTNARNIARLVGTKFTSKMSEDRVAAAEKTLHSLVSLYALSYQGTEVLSNAAEVLKAENARKDGNGIEFVLKLHQRLEKESQARLFQDSPELMMHGYTPEILNPHTEIQIADEVAGRELMDRGWTKGGEVPVDPADPDRQRRHMYVLRGAGLGARQTGIISWTSMDSKGTKKHSGYLNPANQTGMANAQLNASVINARQTAVQKMFTVGATFDPTKVGTTYMAPVINPKGDIVNWRYMMQEQTKDTLLERDNRFEHILGALAGSIFDKETSAEQNRKAIQVLKDQYDAEYAKDPKRYIIVSPTSKDADLREIWALLPDATRSDVRKIWGMDGMYVRKDSVDIVFGYRKLSVATMFEASLDARQRLADQGLGSRVWDLDNEEFNILEKTAVMAVEGALLIWARSNGMNQQQAEAYSKRSAVVITRAGRMWGEVVAETKDLIVVKTGMVMLDNIWSNISLLVLSGVPIKDILHHHMVALKGATSYHADMDDLQRLRLLLNAGHTQGQEKEIRRDIARLEDAIARNPITKLVDAGLMPTIVEDIASEEDIYSYKSALIKKTDAITTKMPEHLKSAVKTVYMTHDTPLYQGLSRVTQLSDFVARYTLYQHLTNRKVEPLSEKEALSRSVDAFIMYDVPMHPLLQYADDTGLFMFTKYFLRIQRVLRTLWHEQPARVGAALMLDNTIGLGPIVLDSAAMFRIGNPLNVGAFKIFGSLDELATVKPVISLFGGGRAW